MPEPGNILILKPSALGDVVLAMPAFNTLRASFPEANISWLVRPEFAPVFDGTPRPDKLVIFDRKALSSWYCNPKTCAELVKFLKQLRKSRYDLVIDLQGLFRTALFGWATAAKKRLGMDIAREMSGWFYTQTVAHGDQPLHLVEYYNRIAARAGAKQIVTEAELTPSDEAVTGVRGKLNENGLEFGQYAVLVTGAARDYKIWPAERFAQIAEHITNRFGLKVAAVGAPSESPAVEKIISLCKTNIVNLAGKTDIAELVAVMAGAKLAVSGDTGPGHIAWATGTPTVFIFGPTNPSRVGPYNKPQSVAAHEPFSRGPDIENHDYKITDVTTEMVIEAVQNTLQ